MPCPSCGSTRSVMAITQGKIAEALYLNPFGILIALVMLITPIWLLRDVFAKKDSLLQFYQKLEVTLKKKRVALPLIVLVIVNWAWNITKGL